MCLSRALAMPIVVASDSPDDPDSRVHVIVPRRDGSEWRWDEVGVFESPIEGFGLQTRENAMVDWSDLTHPVYLPIVGRETELGSSMELDVFVRVLTGMFIEFTFDLMAPAPSRSCWVTNGVYVELVRTREIPSGWRRLDADERLLQVLLQSVTHAHEPDACVYLLRDAAMRLLHIPPHVFDVLTSHRHYQHVDRHFATHVVSYRAASDKHLLVNTHPIYADTAYAAGCINEPPVDGSPSMEMCLAELCPLPAAEQLDPSALKHWAAFTEEYPEVRQRHIFFVSQKQAYELGEELTASYGADYTRSYAAHGFASPSSTTVHDVFDALHLANRSWPHSVPAWWNPDMQPLARPALCRQCVSVNKDGDGSTATSASQKMETRIEVVPDDERLVDARRQLALTTTPAPPARSPALGESRVATKTCAQKRPISPQPPPAKRQARLTWRERKERRTNELTIERERVHDDDAKLAELVRLTPCDIRKADPPVTTASEWSGDDDHDHEEDNIPLSVLYAASLLR